MIIGVPRSGTSILGRVLDRHPRISTWVEPYYIWDHHFREKPHDQMTAEEATAEVKVWVRKNFTAYLKAIDAELVVDKSPRHCLKIPFVRQIFPEARYIFIFRDGRDTILSMFRQWQIKKEIFGETGQNNQLRKRIFVLRRWLKRRPLWRFRLQSILFELGSPSNWFKKKFLPQIRWEGRFGWGPRFNGWQEIVDHVSHLEFSAHQWIHCARGILDNMNLLPAERCIALKYEDFIGDPQSSLESIFQFLGKKLPDGFMDIIPEIRADNSNKWRQAFTKRDIQHIGPIIGKTLIEYGYENDEAWYQSIDQ